MPILTTSISGWGRYPVQSCELERPERYIDLAPHAPQLIVRGQGRSYGDASLNENGRVLLSERINRLLALDEQQGILRAEAGVTLAEILQVIVPKGWFLPVTPGTKFVSLGGCVAADVHGKNHHHDGSFGDHVLALAMILADGSRIQCSPTENAELFWATVGGMGLTGIIGEVTLKLIPIDNAQVQVRHHAAINLEQLFKLLQDPSVDDRYSVAWIDSLARGKDLGRGVAMFGHHASAAELGQRKIKPYRPRQRNMPFDLPSFALNPLSIGAFNALYYRREGSKQEPFLSHYDPYFYPLDAIGQWNRLYGKRGFVQYQCVIPEATAYDGMAALLHELTASGRPSFLAVLKRFGVQGRGLLSFPTAGYTLALDLPIRDSGLFMLLDKLDQIVLKHSGRLYLAKDARLSADTFRAMYPRHAEWCQVKRCYDPDGRFSSSLSRRLQLGRCA
ncbi:MAG TPA: FAD-binding oxidoreductase [Gallionellaceae bacterium]